METVQEAVKDVVTAYTRMAEPLYDDVLFLTYHRLLLLASGIILNEKDQSRYKMVAAATEGLDDCVAKRDQNEDPIARKVSLFDIVQPQHHSVADT